MSVATLPRPVDVNLDDGDEPTHYFCSCTPDVALCGAPVAGFPIVESDVSPGDDCPLCVVLFDANGELCVRCGR